MWSSVGQYIRGENRKRLLGNFLSLSGLQVVTYLLPLITIPYLVRVLGPGKFGILGFAQAFIQYFVLFTDYGFNLSATREISIHREDPARVSEIFSAVLLLKLVFLFLSFGIVAGLVFSFAKFRSDWIVYLFTFGSVVGTALFPLWLFQGIERMSYISFLNILSKLIFTVAIFVFIRKPSHFIYVPLLNSIGLLVGGIWALWIVFRELKVKLILPTWESLKFHLKEGGTVCSSILAINGYMNTRVFAVGMFAGDEITGYFSMAEKLITIVQLFPLSSFFQATYPRLSKIYSEDPARGIRTMKRFQNTTDIFFLLYLPVLFIFAPTIISLVFGSPFETAITAFRLLLISVFFMNANVFRGNFLFVMGQRSLYMRIHVISGTLGIVATFILGYLFGYPGVIAAVTVTALAIVLWTRSFYRRGKPAE